MLSGFQPLLLVLWKCQLTAQLWNVQDIAFGNHTLLTRTMAPLKYVLRWRIGQKDLKPPVRLRSGFSRLTGEFVHLWLDRIHPIPPAAASAWPGDVFFLVSGLPSGFLALSWLASHLSHCCPVLCSVHPIGDWRGGGGSVEPSRVGGSSNLSKHPRRRAWVTSCCREINHISCWHTTSWTQTSNLLVVLDTNE